MSTSCRSLNGVAEGLIHGICNCSRAKKNTGIPACPLNKHLLNCAFPGQALACFFYSVGK